MMSTANLRAVDALQRLQEGNRRFVDNAMGIDALLNHARRAEQARDQNPFAVVLGCSDSRAPAEIVFDQGVGDLFVIRVAGHVAAPSQIGSIEFAVEHFGVRLVVVLGHSNCGVVRATVEHCRHPSATTAGLRAIVERIAPGVEPLVERHPEASNDWLVARGVRANVEATVQMLRAGSPLLAGRIDRGDLLVVGSEYDLFTGEAAFFDVDAGHVRAAA